jgi:predicted ATPase
VPAIASALRFSFYSGENEETDRGTGRSTGVQPHNARGQLVDFLHEKQALLLLDNVEHLLEGAPVIEELLAGAPAMRMLVTSREALNIGREWLRPVEGMAFPAATDTLNEAGTYAALRLFEERARQVQTDFDLLAELEDVARICRLVEGMPLGIELAAAWLRLMSPGEIADEIEKNLDFLESTRRGGEGRHRSLRSVFEYSWNLLAEEEQAVLGRLSVFAGGFSRAAAKEVAGAGLPMLMRLTDKSLVRPVREGRYDMHEVVRQYAAEKLAEDQQQYAATHERHLAYYAARMEEMEADYHGPQQMAILAEVKQDLDNLRAAAEWGTDHYRLAELAPIGAFLARFYTSSFRNEEGRELFKQAIKRLEAAPPSEEKEVLLARMLMQLALFTKECHLWGESARLARKAFARAARLEPRPELIEVLSRAGFHGVNMSPEREVRVLDEALEMARREGLPWHESSILKMKGGRIVKHMKGKLDEARRLLHESLAIAKALGDPSAIADRHAYLGSMEWHAGNLDESETHFRDALSRFEAMGNRHSTAVILNTLGLMLLGKGEAEESRRLLERGVRLAKEIGDRSTYLNTLDSLGDALLALGETEEARAIHQQRRAEVQDVEDPLGVAFSDMQLAKVARAAGDYAAAEEHLLDALEGYQASRQPLEMSMMQLELAVLALEQARWRKAAEHLRLARPDDFDYFPTALTLVALAHTARLLVGLGEHERAAQLVGRVIHHPDGWRNAYRDHRPFSRDLAAELLPELQAGLGQDKLAGAMGRGEDLAPEEAWLAAAAFLDEHPVAAGH